MTVHPYKVSIRIVGTKDKILNLLKENLILGYLSVGLLGFILGFLVFYLVVSFVILDFSYLFRNSEWSEYLRVLCIIFSMSTTFASIVLYWDRIN